MGSGSFDAKAYRSYASNASSKPRDEVFESRKLDPKLDPKGVKVRESRDSADNPNSRPIIVALDVTGSMGLIAEHIAKGGLGTLFQGILDRKPVVDPHLMFMGIGDAACDAAPLQVSQFEADNRIVDQLASLWLEGGGGGNDHESYDLPWYFAARHTRHDAMEKRGRRGYLVTVGDELAPRQLLATQLERVLGYRPEDNPTSPASLKAAQRLYDVFHVIIEEGNYASSNLDGVRKSWNALLGQHVLSLSDHRLLPETIVAAIQVAEGVEHDKATSGWGSAAKAVIGGAVSSLPRGAPAPRQLGR